MDVEAVKEAVKVLLENDLQVSDGFYTLYHANGELMTGEDPTVWVISGVGKDEKWNLAEGRFYQEYATEDEAIDAFAVGEYELETTSHK